LQAPLLLAAATPQVVFLLAAAARRQPVLRQTSGSLAQQPPAATARCCGRVAVRAEQGSTTRRTRRCQTLESAQTIWTRGVSPSCRSSAAVLSAPPRQSAWHAAVRRHRRCSRQAAHSTTSPSSALPMPIDN
jgi:hypothetical protein